MKKPFNYKPTVKNLEDKVNFSVFTDRTTN